MIATTLRRGVCFASTLLLAITMASLTAAPAQAATTDPVPSCTIELVSGDPVVMPAPPPFCFDRSGSDMDEFEVPETGGIYGYAATEGGVGYYPGYIESTNGRASLSIKSFNRWGPRVIGPVWKLSFNTAVTGVQSPNALSAKVTGPCNYSGIEPRTPVSVTVINPFDGSYRYESVVILAVKSNGWKPFPSKVVLERVADGESRTATLGQGGSGSFQHAGFQAGWYNISAHRLTSTGDTGRKKLYTTKLWVPSCGSTDPVPRDGPPPPGGTQPPPDNNGDNGGGDTTKAKQPRAKVQQLRVKGKFVSAARVKLINRKVKVGTKFKVIVNPRRGKTFTLGANLKPGAFKKMTVRRPVRTVVTVKARIKNGSGKWRWKKLDRMVITKRVSVRR